MRRAPARWLVLVALLAVPAKWRASVRQDLEEEADSGAGVIATCWRALTIGAALRRDGRVTASRPRAFAGLSVDVVQAWRGFRREPAAIAAIVFTLAIGIGAATAAHAVFNFALFRPVPGVADQDALISVYFQPNRESRSRRGTPFPRLRAMRDATGSTLSGLAASGSTDLPFSSSPGVPPTVMNVFWTTRDYFQTLGVRARAGRLFDSDDYELPGAAVAVVSERLWHREFAGRADIIGHTIVINADPFTIIGVTSSFRGVQQLGTADVWLPAGAVGTFVRDGDSPGFPYAMSLVGRLRPGVTRGNAETQLAASWNATGDLRAAGANYSPFASAGLTDGIGLTRSRLLAIYRVLMAGVVLLFVLAAANAANLMLARHARHAADLSVRGALGASRARLVRALIVDAAALASAAAVAGLGIAFGLIQFFASLRILSYLPALDDLTIDWRVAAFALLAAPVTTMVFGVGPAVIASRIAPSLLAASANRRSTIRSGRLRTALVCVQLAVSLTLVVGAAVLVQSLATLRRIDLGMDIQGVTAFVIRPRIVSDMTRRASSTCSARSS